MTRVTADDFAARARQRDLVRRGYDTISEAYRSDDGQAASSSAEDVSRYAGWVAELAGLLPAGARVLDLGCGAGIPATSELTARGLQVIGVDFAAAQLRRARRLVPAASLVQADMTALALRPASVDAVVSFYALIHVPLADQRALFPRIRGWLRFGTGSSQRETAAMPSSWPARLSQGQVDLDNIAYRPAHSARCPPSAGSRSSTPARRDARQAGPGLADGLAQPMITMRSRVPAGNATLDCDARPRPPPRGRRSAWSGPCP
jgi:SAM-dependent methyltransferase